VNFIKLNGSLDPMEFDEEIYWMISVEASVGVCLWSQQLYIITWIKLQLPLDIQHIAFRNLKYFSQMYCTPQWSLIIWKWVQLHSMMWPTEMNRLTLLSQLVSKWDLWTSSNWRHSWPMLQDLEALIAEWLQTI